ncbi:general substrate transporter [Dothidotthia symphoricarpi CBS 119687]|uniref:General substrate transporter n=1 Tax=Dothidotthia symphoricarpi CBS 119687 TaxID=1392245 RepID=A0A6A6AJQ4_9PLEO|nr:general substrate transporter [Dothidotthia symphoricarpi CBS 119687]KAF2131463.1 general substrate transporter [Dothidotthia symphoricarpi CBS 119687]
MFSKLPKIYNVYFLACIATMGGMLFGFDISSMSAIIGTDQYKTYFNNPAGLIQGVIGSALAAGSVLGSIVAGPLSDKVGRRDALVYSCIFWLIGTSVQVACNSRGMLIAGRVLNGITVGITSSQVPVYLAEVAKPGQRGSIIIIQQLAIEWGILIMYFIGYGCSFIKGETASFRTAWGIQFVPCVFFMIGLPFLPESPRWLAKVDRTEEALHVLANIQAAGDLNDPYVIAEYEEIITVLTAERLAPKSWRKFVYNGMWRRTLTGFSVQAWQQLSGANVMTYYVVYIFTMANLSGNINLISSGVQYALFIIFSSIMFVFVDKIGRRTLLIWGAVAMGVCHMVVGGTLGAHYTYVPDGVGGDKNVVMRVTGSPAYTVIAFSYLLIIIYALTLAPICWVYAAEVWSLETRAVGMGISSIGNWVFNFAIGLFIPPGFLNIRWGLFITFGAMCFLAAAHFWLAYPETCQKTIEEIEEMFSDNGPKAWKTKMGHSKLEDDATAVASEQVKGEARASIEKALEHTHRTESV